MQVTAPDTITSWVASAFAVSSDVGLGVAPDTAKVSVFLLVTSIFYVYKFCIKMTVNYIIIIFVIIIVVT